jgi:copper chaperone CopZ
MEKEIFTIPNISCGHCVATISNELKEIEGVDRVAGDPQAKTITVELQAPATAKQIQTKLVEIGYPPA